MKKLFSIATMALICAALFGTVSCNDNNKGSLPEVDPVTVSFTAGGGTKTVTVTSSSDWSVLDDVPLVTPVPKWIEVEKTNATTLSITVDATTEARSGEIAIANETGGTTITVTQSAPDYTISIDPETPIVFNAMGGSRSIKVTSEADWTPSSSDEWIDVDREGDNLIVSVDPSTGAEKTGTVTIDNGGEEAVSIEVTQQELRFAVGNGSYSLSNGIHVFVIYFQTEFEGDNFSANMIFFSEKPLPGRNANLAAGTYTFHTDNSEPRPFLAPVDPYTSYIDPGEIGIAEGSSFTVEVEGSEYTVKMNFILDDGTEFIATYIGELEITNTSVRSTLMDDLTFNIENGAGSLDFYGDEQFNGTWTFGGSIYDGGIAPSGGGYSGSGHMIRFGDYMIVAPQEGDGTYLPAGTYVITPFQQSPMAGLNTAYVIQNGYEDTMSGYRIGTWYHELTDGFYSNAAPLVEGEITVSYSGDTYTLVFDTIDDAGNKITGTYKGNIAIN